MKTIITIGLILLLIFATGCVGIGKSVSDAYNGARQSIENTNVNSGVCDEDSTFRDTMFVICPEKTHQPVVNVTPA